MSRAKMAIVAFVSGLRVPQRFRSLGYSTLKMRLQYWRYASEEYKSYLDYFHIWHNRKTKTLQLVSFYKLLYLCFVKLTKELDELEQQLDCIDYGQYTKARQALQNVTIQINIITDGTNQTPTVYNIHIANRPVVYWERERLRDIPETSSDINFIDATAKSILDSELDLWKQLLIDIINSIPFYPPYYCN
jgi:hypothetical protein